MTKQDQKTYLAAEREACTSFHDMLVTCAGSLLCSDQAMSCQDNKSLSSDAMIPCGRKCTCQLKVDAGHYGV